MSTQSSLPAIMLCKVYRSERKEGAYLYVPHKPANDALAELPATLLQALGQLTEVMILKLSEQRKLAHADIHKVMSELEESGYYLQLPPLEQNKQ